MEPSGIDKLTYKLTANVDPGNNPSTVPLLKYIEGRFPPDERMTMMATPAIAPTVRASTSPSPPRAQISVRPCLIEVT